MSASKSFEAKELYDGGRFEEVIKLYEETESGYALDQWDCHYYSAALKKTADYREGLKISGQAMEKYPQFGRVASTYCWCLYYLYIRNFSAQEGSESDFFKAVNSVLRHSVQEKYSPYERAAWKAVDYLKSKPNVPYEKVGNYMSFLNPDLLSEEPRKGAIDGRETEIQSEKEKWYSTKSKALLKSGKLEECVTLCEEALSRMKNFHHNNDIWFRYKAAAAKVQMGEIDDAEKIIKDLLMLKEEWVFYNELFLIDSLRGNKAEAVKYASMAALAQGDHKLKLTMYEKLSGLLKEDGMEEMSYLHLVLTKNIREENGWQVNGGHHQKLDSYGMEEPDRRQVIRKLEEFWRENKLKGEKEHIGTIDNILPSGKAGFIGGEDGVRYYFRMNSIRGRRDKAEKGMEVTFYAKDSYDKLKQKASKEAVEIKLN